MLTEPVRYEYGDHFATLCPLWETAEWLLYRHGPMRLKDIRLRLSEFMGCEYSPPFTHAVVKRLVDAGVVHKTGYGTYAHPQSPFC